LLPVKKQEPGKNLFQSVYVEVRNKLFTKLSELETSEISLIPVPKSNEEMGDFSQKMAETMTRIGFNFEDEFVLSCKSVLDDFVAKLSSTLSQDQVAKLKDIVSV